MRPLDIILIALIIWWALVLALCGGRAQGAELSLVEPSKLTMEYYDIANNRDEYLRIDDKGSTKYDSGETWKYGTAVTFNLDLARYDQWALYWNNYVHMAATQVAVRHVGWQFETGIELSKHVDLFYDHHSQHIMDLDRQKRRYPLYNAYGIRLVFIEKGRK